MSEYEKGEYIKGNNPYVKTTPRKWTDSEIEYMLQLKDDGKSIKEICNILDRSLASVQVKLKRLKKTDESYNEAHLSQKNQINQEFVNYLNPDTVLDLYSRNGNIAYTNCNVISNDINADYDCDYNLDALHCLCLLYSQNKKFDLIDLDPFGSAYECFDLAIKMAKKGLCITLGEMGHKRWKRLDFVSLRYGIYDLKDFTSLNLIKKIQEIGRQNKKELVVYTHRDWQNISRVWFIIKPFKQISQWENSNNNFDNLDKWLI